MNKYYLPFLGEEPVSFKSKTTLFVVETYARQLYANSYSNWYQLVEVTQNSTFKNVELDEIKPKEIKKINSTSPRKYTNWIFYKNNLNKQQL